MKWCTHGARPRARQACESTRTLTARRVHGVNIIGGSRAHLSCSLPPMERRPRASVPSCRRRMLLASVSQHSSPSVAPAVRFHHQALVTWQLTLQSLLGQARGQQVNRFLPRVSHSQARVLPICRYDPPNCACGLRSRDGRCGPRIVCAIGAHVKQRQRHAPGVHEVDAV